MSEKESLHGAMHRVIDLVKVANELREGERRKLAEKIDRLRAEVCVLLAMIEDDEIVDLVAMRHQVRLVRQAITDLSARP